MKIGVNASYLLPGKVGGTEIYLRHLLAALAQADGRNDYLVFLNRESAGADLVPTAPRFSAIPTQLTASNRFARILWEQTLLPGLARRHRLDVLFNPGFTAPWFGSTPSVTTFHDLQYRVHPEYFRPLDRVAWRLLLAGVARTSERIVCISEQTKEAFALFYPKAVPRTAAVPSGVDEEFFRRSWSPQSERPYLLCVATLHPHKNLPRLLQAFARLRESHPEARAVLAGIHGFATAEVMAEVAKLGLGGAVDIPGWLPRALIYDLFAGAHAFVLPTEYEGFGLPALEALAMGIPTACSDLPVLSGIVGEAAVRFPARSVDGLSRALRTIWSDRDRREVLSRMGPAQANRFRWIDTARAMVRIFEEAASSRR